MQLDEVLRGAVRDVAQRRGVDEAALGRALVDEDAAQLAEVLALAPADAARTMARLVRAVTVEADLGAGCKLLTDDVAAEVLAVLREL